jgi:hypothetical protein
MLGLATELDAYSAQKPAYRRGIGVLADFF